MADDAQIGKKLKLLQLSQIVSKFNGLVHYSSVKSANQTNQNTYEIFTALHGMQSRYSDGNYVCLSVCLSVCPSVCPSVRPSVKRVHCDKTEESYV